MGTIRFASAGHFDWKIFAPFAALSVPMAFVGGMMKLPIQTYKIILGGVLLFAAPAFGGQTQEREHGRSTRKRRGRGNESPVQSGGSAVDDARLCSEIKPVSVRKRCSSGRLGVPVRGLTGVGGGIFSVRCCCSSAGRMCGKPPGSRWRSFVNSAAGLLGHLASVKNVPSEIIWWGARRLARRVDQAGLGSRRLAPITMRRLLSCSLDCGGSEDVVGALMGRWAQSKPRSVRSSFIQSEVVAQLVQVGGMNFFEKNFFVLRSEIPEGLQK